jgi:hypothetical protein
MRLLKWSSAASKNIRRLRETTSTADLAKALKRIACNTDAFIAVSNGPDDILYLGATRCGACRYSASLPSTLLARATPSTAVLRWRWPKAKAKSKPCALAPRWPASNALGSAAQRVSEVKVFIDKNRLPAAAR